MKAGDEVLSADPRTGQQSYQPVVRTFVHQTDALCTVRTQDGQSVECTPEHPFWVEGKGFVAAKRLARSDLLVDADGRGCAVASVSTRRERCAVYNFEVAGTHTYFVGAGRWWVHNACGNITHAGPLTEEEALRLGEQWLGPGYREMTGRAGVPGSGVYRSADGLRQFRMAPGDLAGTHPLPGYGKVPHVHFEALDSTGRVIENNHVPIIPGR